MPRLALHAGLISCDAAISACERGARWHESRELLSVMVEKMLGMSSIAVASLNRVHGLAGHSHAVLEFWEDSRLNCAELS